MTNKFERQVKGLLGTKLGMTQVWDEDGKFVPVTVVKADSNVVTQIRTRKLTATKLFRSVSVQSTLARLPSPWLVTSRRPVSPPVATSSSCVPQMLLSIPSVRN